MATNRHEQTRTRTNKIFFLGLTLQSLFVSVRVCSCLFVVMGLLLSAPVKAAEIAHGVLTNVAGDVEVRKRGGGDWVQAHNAMEIGPGDQISTGVNGRARLSIKDSRTDIAPLTEFTVGRSVANDAGQEQHRREGGAELRKRSKGRDGHEETPE